MSLLELMALCIIIGIFSGITAAILGLPMGIFLALCWSVAALMGAFND